MAGQKFQDIIADIKAREPVLEDSVPITMGLTMLEAKNIGTVTIGMTDQRMRQHLARTILFVILFSSGGAIILGLFLSFASKNIIFDPLSELVRASSRLAQGDLSAAVGIRTMGEVKTLVDSFNEMVTNLERVTVSRNYVDNILNSMINTLIVVSSDNKIVSANTSTCRLLGYEKNEIIGQPLEMITKNENSDREIWMKNLLADDHIANIEEVYKTKDGRDVPVLLSAAVMRDENHLVQEIIYVAQDITERKQAEDSLKESEERLRDLTSQLLDSQEQERKRIAQELHDDLGQSLLLLKLQLSSLSRKMPSESQELQQQFLNSIDNVQDMIDSVHLLSQNLIPPTLTEIGLKAAITDLLEEFSLHSNIACSLEIDEIKDLFSPNTELILYRILQESLSNIGKYSQATQVAVTIRVDHQAWFSVEDNGIGFEIDQILARRGRKRGLGLASMKERASLLGGTFHLWSKPKTGTKIQITVPLKNETLT